MPAPTSRVPAHALWTVWKFWREFCTQANFPSSFRAGVTIRALSASVRINGCPRFAALVGALFRRLDRVFGPDGHHRQSDKDSNRHFKETRKRNDHTASERGMSTIMASVTLAYR